MEANNALSSLAELLNIRTPPATNATKSFARERDKHKDYPTILDLKNHDRHRILKLIEELLDAQEEADKLRQKLDDEKTIFRDKRSSLIKKLDLLSEKHERAQAEIDNLRERHHNSLVNLEQKVSSVSLKLEASLAEIKKLRLANTELKKENMDLRKLNQETTATVASIHQENSNLSLQIEANKLKERKFKREIQSLVSTDKMAFKGNHELRHSLSFLYPLEHLHETVNASKACYPPPSTTVGAGDFFEATPSSTGLNTIKAPDKVGFDEITQSTFAFRSNSKSDYLANNTEQIPNSINNQSEASDMDLLANLFFRF